MEFHVSARSFCASWSRWVLSSCALLAIVGVLYASAPEGDDLARDARSPYADKRRRAIAKLATRGDREAFEIVFRALGDDDSEVADEAQLRLPEFACRGVRRDVGGRDGLRSKDDRVRRRVAEALGRWTEAVDARELVRALDKRDVRCTRLVLWSFERLARRELLTGGSERAVESALRRCLSVGTDDRIRAAALAALTVVDPESALTIALDVLDADSGRQVTCSALTVLAEVASSNAGRSASVFDRLEGALSHSDAAVRLHTTRLIACGYARRSTLLELVKRLPAEPRPVCRDGLLRTLRRITGMSFGESTRTWTAWAQDRPDEWRPRLTPSNGDGSGPNAAVRTRSVPASLGALDPASDRIALLVDFSGSLWNERKDGTRKKDTLDPQVTRLLDRLESECLFFLVPYTADCHPHTDAPVRATRRRVASAKAFFERATMRGQGDLWGAAQLALDQESIDRILIVTDGAPTGGAHWNAELIVDLLLESTRFRPAVFDFVLEGAPKRLEKAWRRLATETGGRVLIVDG